MISLLGLGLVCVLISTLNIGTCIMHQLKFNPFGLIGAWLILSFFSYTNLPESVWLILMALGLIISSIWLSIVIKESIGFNKKSLLVVYLIFIVGGLFVINTIVKESEEAKIVEGENIISSKEFKSTFGFNVDSFGTNFNPKYPLKQTTSSIKKVVFYQSTDSGLVFDNELNELLPEHFRANNFSDETFVVIVDIDYEEVSLYDNYATKGRRVLKSVNIYSATTSELVFKTKVHGSAPPKEKSYKFTAPVYVDGSTPESTHVVKSVISEFLNP